MNIRIITFKFDDVVEKIHFPYLIKNKLTLSKTLFNLKKYNQTNLLAFSFLMFFGKVVIWRMGPAPPGWALHRDAGIQEGGYPPCKHRQSPGATLCFCRPPELHF